MKVMGLNDLRLVSPAKFPSAEATAMAAGADDILSGAKVYDDLSAALSGVSKVYGTTARERRIDWPAANPRDAAGAIAATDGSVALVFGREKSGLTNAELDLCQVAIHIPTNESYRSLNLAQAVQICAYEVRLACTQPSPAHESRKSKADIVATAEQVEHLQNHAMSVMRAVGYVHPDRPKLIERRLRRVLNQTRLRHSEIQIMRGFLSAIEARLGETDDE